MAKIQKRDLFKTKKSQDALTAFQGCQGALQSYTRRVYLQEGIESFPGGDDLADDATLSELE